MSPPSALERHRRQARERLRAAGATRAGSGSVSWKINREIIVVAGWGRAILLQLAHPLVAAGVDEHSHFRGGVSSGFARLWSTVGAMLTLTFGAEDDAITAAARINVIHDRVFGQLPSRAGLFAPGTRYSAHDADLLRWVHATLLDSLPRTYELLVGPLAPEEREQYCAEARVMGPLLDIPDALLPATTADLEAYVAEMLDSGRLVVTPGSMALARAVLFPPRWRLLWPLFRPMQLITIGLLPARIREAYGFHWTARDARALQRWVTALRWLHWLTPRLLREWPSSRGRQAGVARIPAAG